MLPQIVGIVPKIAMLRSQGGTSGELGALLIENGEVFASPESWGPGEPELSSGYHSKASHPGAFDSA
jgi:hypothetical protein